MKIVVTGAAGHIGSFVVRYFATQFPGAEIVMLDNMTTQRYCSLFNLPTTVNFRFAEMDVRKTDLQPYFEGADAVLHLAALTDAAGSFNRAEEIEENNFQATQMVATACANTGARLIALSSTSVYGSTRQYVSEDCDPSDLNPQSPYAVTKLNEERLVQELVANSGLRAISCRFGTIFGTSLGMRFHTAVNKFCWQAAMGLPITVWRTALDQKRPYLDLFDAARALSFIIKNDIFDGGIYNVLTLNATVRDIVSVVAEYVPDIQVGFVDSPIMNELSFEVVNDRFIGLGFSFCGDLRRGVGDTIGMLKGANA